jgi:pimeloyl-ACP methyl ester carboxylesterase/DNA-binding winged helix-turn-helix (wHTH) protein
VTVSPHTPLIFGPFRLDPASGQVYRGASVVPLTPKAFGILHVLAGRAGELVSKRELLDAGWPGVFVGDAVLKVTIREIRKALGDDPRAPRFIETAYRRGYRFVATVQAVPPAAAGALPATTVQGTGSADLPPVRYAHSGHVNIAYQVIGSGPPDIVFVMGWVSHLEYFWREPSFARFLTRLSSMGRLIVFDKRGTGRSDPVPVSQLPTLDERLDDVRAVMEAAGSERAVLVGVSEGGPLSILFAATYPERTEALIMIGSYARRLADADYPWGQTRDEHEALCRMLVDAWGGPVGLEARAPSRAGDEAFRDWWASYLRMGASPGAAVALTRMNAQIDVRALLPSVQVPTLVLHRTGDRCLKVEEGRYLAARIPGATFVELPGADHLPFVGDQDAILNEIERFLSRARGRAAGERVLATVLAVRVDCPDEDRALVARVFERDVSEYRGRVIGRDGRLWLAAFDGPGRAVRCGRSIAGVAARSSIAVRAGVHVGEYDAASAAGPLTTASAALAAAAGPGEVLVSRTIVDLVPGSGFAFEDRPALDVPGLSRPLATQALV